MKAYLAIFLAGVAASLVTTPLWQRYCEQRQWLDFAVDGRRVHRRPVPRLGGVAVFVSLFIALAVLPIADTAFSFAIIERHQLDLLAILIPAVIVFVGGIYDDFRALNSIFKLIFQLTAAGLFVYFFGGMKSITVPFLGSVEIAPSLGVALSLGWIIIVTNAFNLIDGMDGLASGAALFAALVVLVVSLLLGHPTVTIIVAGLCGALIGFLRYNFNPASIFLGDSGSQVIGFILAASSLMGSQKASTAVAVAIPLIACGLPVLDVSIALLRRFISGRPLFDGDKEHIHHKLLELGWSQRRVALALYGLCAFFGLTALLFVNDYGNAVTGFVLTIIAVTVLTVIWHLRYQEVNEVKALVMRGSTEGRRRIANNVSLRKISERLGGAESYHSVCNNLSELFALGEFVSMRLTVQMNHRRERLERLSDDLLTGATPKTEITIVGDDFNIFWSGVKRGRISDQGYEDSQACWSMNLELGADDLRYGNLEFKCAYAQGTLRFDADILATVFRRRLLTALKRLASEPGGAEANYAPLRIPLVTTVRHNGIELQPELSN